MKYNKDRILSNKQSMSVNIPSSDISDDDDNDNDNDSDYSSCPAKSYTVNIISPFV